MDRLIHILLNLFLLLSMARTHSLEPLLRQKLRLEFEKYDQNKNNQLDVAEFLRLVDDKLNVH